MKRKLFQRLLIALLAIVLGIIKIWTDSQDQLLAIYLLAMGAIISIVSITIYLRKYEKEDDLSKEFDERDAHIEGQASNLTLQFIVLIMIVLLFLSNFILFSVQGILFILLLALGILNTVIKYYYERVL